MTHDLIRRGTRQAEALETEFGGVSAAFLAAVALLNEEGTAKAPPEGCHKPLSRPARPRSLYEIAEALDLQNGLSEEHKASSVRAYRIFYGALSESAAHGGLAALRRFTEMRNGRAAVRAGPGAADRRAKAVPDRGRSPGRPRSRAVRRLRDPHR